MKIDLKGIQKVAKKFHLDLIILFGSQIGKTHNLSDVDLAFFSRRRVDEQKLYEEFSSFLKRADIDLVNLFTTHNHLLRYQILSTGKVLYESRKGVKSRMESESYFDYVDFKRYYDSRSSLLDKKLAELVA